MNKLNTNDGKSWEASYRIRDNDTGLLEWTIGAKDPAGNALVKADNVSSVSSLKIDWFDNKTDNVSYKADTTFPELDNLTLSRTTLKGAQDYDNSSLHVLKSGDNLTLAFTTDEPVDNTSLSVHLLIGADHHRLPLTNLDSNQGKSWETTYTITDNDSGLIQWSLSGIDRAGNTLVKDPNLSRIPSLDFAGYTDVSGTVWHEADTTTPKLDNLSVIAGKARDAFRYDNSSRHVLKTGDNLMLVFKTDEPVDNTSLSVSLKIGTDNVSDRVIFSGSRQSWQAFYQVRDNDMGLFEWTISGIDRAGNGLEKHTNLTSISSLVFESFDNGTGPYWYEADTSQPRLDNLSIAAVKVKNAFHYDNSSLHV